MKSGTMIDAEVAECYMIKYVFSFTIKLFGYNFNVSLSKRTKVVS